MNFLVDAQLPRRVAAWLTAAGCDAFRLAMHEMDEVADLRALRDQMACRHGGDPMSLVRELSERSLAAGRELVRLPR